MTGNYWNAFRRAETTPQGIFAVAQLNARAQPMDRNACYEGPMDDILQAAG